MDVKLPEQIQRQLDQAAAIEAELYGNAETPVVGNTEAVPEAAPEVVVPAEQPAEPVAPQVTPPVHDAWEQKFNVLQGKYNAEMPRLHTQVRELTEQLQTALRAMEKPAAPDPVVPMKITAADEDKFGADLLDAMRRTAQDEVSKVTKEIDARVDTKVKPVADTLQQTVSDNFWSAVDSGVPDFNAVNVDPRWFQYLDTRIAGTKMSRRDAAEAAVAKHDASSLVELVNDWKRSITPPASPQPPVVVPVNTEAQANLNRQVAPYTRKDAAAPQATGRIWSGAEYQAALDPRNEHRMPHAEYEALVAVAEMALAEGRIRW